MLTFIKQIFVWWNQETIGTKFYTIFFGKLEARMILETNIMKIKKKIRDGYCTKVN